MNKPWLVASVFCCLGFPAQAMAQSISEDSSDNPSDASSLGTDSTLGVLFEQAEFWRDRQRDDLASQTLERILSVDPGNREALYRLARNALDDGRLERAEQWEGRLANAASDDPRVMELRQARRIRGASGELLEQARAEARAGRYDQSIDAYQRLMGVADTEAGAGSERPARPGRRVSDPDVSSLPRDLVPEYYLTLAGDDNGWEEARQALERWHQRYPDDGAISTALAQVLSYREATRRRGIDMLAELAADNAQARRAWRESLGWLDATPADAARYSAYQEAYPDGDDMLALYEDKVAVTRVSPSARHRTQGYEQLEEGRLAQATKAFEAALDVDDQDADAQAGLGLVALRRDDYSAAVAGLERAMQLAPEKRGQWLEAYSTATFLNRLAQARYSVRNGNLEQALDRVQPLTQGSGANARAARLLEADVLKRQGRLDAAEQRYRAVLESHGSSTPARLGLINVLERQQRWQEAERLVASLPASAREEVGDMRSTQAQALRRQAASQLPAEAESTLRRALELDPTSPWVRLELARLIDQRGQPRQARKIVAPMPEERASPEHRYAAALLASEQKRWTDSQDWLAGIAPALLSKDMRDLAEEVQAKARLANARQQLASGNRRGAQVALQELLVSAPDSPALRGQAAALLTEMGRTERAVALIQPDLSLTGDGRLTAPASTYLDHVQVLAKAGRQVDAERLADRMADADDFTAATGRALDAIFAGVVVARADRLRESGQLGRAYDVLAQRLANLPDNPDLLLAMARLYDTGERTTQAQQLYDYVLDHHPDSQPALLGAVNIALTRNEVTRAANLLSRHGRSDMDTPELLLANARVADARGDSRRAIALLERARMALPSRQESVLAQGNNPFRDARPDARATRPAWLPGGGAPLSGQASSADPAGGAAADTSAVSGALALEQNINRMLDELRRQRQPRVNTGLALAMRDGEEGLSQLDLIETPVGISAPLGGGRMELKMTPTHAAAGTPQGESQRRLGYGAVTDGAERFGASLDELEPVLDAIEASAVAFDEAEAYYQAALADAQVSDLELVRLENEREQAKTRFEDEASEDLFAAIGIDLAALDAKQLERLGIDAEDMADGLLDSTSLAAFQDSRERIESAVATAQGLLGKVVSDGGTAQAQRDAGMALELAYRGDSLDLDIGSTPLGFEETNLVGGLRWHPNVTDNTELSLTAERRGVKDSLLSYAGTRDSLSGESWGGVVKTGGKLGIAHDDEDMGLYSSIGAYRYTGTNVADNRSVEAGLGGYVQALRTDNSSLQTGVHVNYMDFDENLSKHSFGHGGYFSPQNHVSVSFPINYRHDSGKMRYTASITPGFQSYSEQASDYFPTDDAAQEAMDLLADIGVVPESRYGASSESGLGLTLGAGAEYQLNDSVRLGGKLGYDTFGDYNESSAMLYMNYQLGAGND